MSAWTLEDDGEIVVGESVIKREGIDLYVSDRYGSYSFILDPDSKVEVIPVPPMFRLGRLTNYVCIDIDKTIVGIGGKTYWLTMPYELAVVVNGRTIAVVSPNRIKYELFGSIVEGIVCRHHKSEVFKDSSGIGTELGRLLVTLPLSREANSYSKVIINTNSIRLYRLRSDVKVYYEVVRLSPNPLRPIAEPLGKPPKSNLEEVTIPKDITDRSVMGVQYGYYGPD